MTEVEIANLQSTERDGSSRWMIRDEHSISNKLSREASCQGTDGVGLKKEGTQPTRLPGRRCPLTDTSD